MNKLLDEFAFQLEMNVEWGDMDALQHVNNVEYFKYFQKARIAYFEKNNSDNLFTESRISTILASTQCKFIYPLKYPDTIVIGVRVDSIANDYFTMKYAVISNNNQRLVAIGDAKVVMFDYEKNKKTSIPEVIKERIIELEKTEIKFN
jgi:acyl-CoA thioester hydrolase